MKEYNFKVKEVVDFLQRDISRIIKEKSFKAIHMNCSLNPVAAYVAVHLIEQRCPQITVIPYFTTFINDTKKKEENETYLYEVEPLVRKELEKSHACVMGVLQKHNPVFDSENHDLHRRIMHHYSMYELYRDYTEDSLIVDASNEVDIYLGRTANETVNLLGYLRYESEYLPFGELTYSEIIEIGNYLKLDKKILSYTPISFYQEDGTEITDIELSSILRSLTIENKPDINYPKFASKTISNRIPIVYFYNIRDN